MLLRKKVTSIVATGAMVMSLFAGMTSMSFATDGTWAGSGTAEAPYQIAGPADLTALANAVNGGTSYSNTYFELTDDITVASDWTGIGNPTVVSIEDINSPYVASGNGFAGILDGNGNEIILGSETRSNSAVGGLINYLAPGGQVSDLTVSGSITVTDSSVQAAGGVVGYNSGIVNKVTNNVSVTATGTYNVGGIAGFNDNYYMAGAIGLIQNSKNTADVSGYAKVGGITGENSGTIASSSNSGNITGNYNRKSGIGGIAGRNGNNNTAIETGVISTCLNTGNVNAGDGSWAGGIAGFQNSKSSASYSCSLGTVTAGRNSGSIIGSNEGTITACCDTDSTDLSVLTGGDSMYGTWSNTTDPALAYDANVTGITEATGWGAPSTDIYLDGTATENGNGTESSPYNDLSDAVDAANGGTVIITGTVEITGGNYYDSVTFERAANQSGPMFKINAPDNEYGTAYVTMSSATVKGNGSDTLFDVTQGRLRLRGNITLQNCAVGVDVSGNGQVEVNYANITATQYSVKTAGADNTFVLNSFGANNVTLGGKVYLGTGSYITVESAIAGNVAGTIAVEMQQTSDEPTVAKGSGYTMNPGDAQKVTSSQGSIILEDNELYLNV